MAGLIEARTAFGNGQQWIFVLPGLDMAVTILGGRYNDVTTGATLGTRIARTCDCRENRNSVRLPKLVRLNNNAMEPTIGARELAYAKGFGCDACGPSRGR